MFDNGHISQAAISPDGVYLLQALVKTDYSPCGCTTFRRRPINKLWKPAATIYEGLTFSPDGNYIYFVRREEAEESISVLYRASVLGGEPRSSSAT